MTEAAETALPLARKAAQHLAERGIENARLDAELLLSSILGIGRLELYLQHDRPVRSTELEQFRTLIRRRLRREPVQYILGRASFRKLELQVDGRVLIPRPETETLVDHVVRWLAGRSEPVRVLDLGTGSGAIALSLAREAGVQVVATDASQAALDVARANANRLGLRDSVEFRAGSLWEPLKPNERFAAIVSNPPYVAETVRETLMPEVRDWEPAQALFSGRDGLNVIRAIVAEAFEHLEPGGLLALEIGADQGEAVRELLARKGRYTNIRIQRDLAGRERVALAESSKE